LVEGPTDKKIFTKIKFTYKRINFEIYGGGSNISTSVIEKISKTSNIGIIKDRDFYSISEMQTLENKSPGNISFLPKREIENYALDSKELFEIYETLGTSEIKHHDEFVNVIKKISEKYIQQTISDMYFFNYNKQQKIPQPKIEDSGKAIVSIEQYYEKRIERISQLKTNIDLNVTTIEKELCEKWSEEWITYVDAKLLLKEIAKQFFKNKYSGEDLMDMILLKWIDKNSFPQELIKSLQKLI